jgi:hypothetical protein
MKMLDYFAKIGVDQQHLFDYLSVEKIDEIDTDMCVELRGLATAIKEGTTDVQSTFFPKPETKEATQEEVDPSKDLFGNEANPEKPKRGRKGGDK